TREAAGHIPPHNIIGEPMGRDTAAAVALACGLVRQRDPDGVAAILTADQLMTDVNTFRRTLDDSLRVASRDDVIVTIGITPTYPATGFGYIRAGALRDTSTATRFFTAEAFVEKPDEPAAARYVAEGVYHWNAGMFIWRARTMQNALAAFTPRLAELSDAVAECGDVDATLNAIYPALSKISIDYAVMEHAKNIVVAEGNFGWDDVGTWSALAGHFAPDVEGNIAIGGTETLDARNNIIVSENHLTAVIGVDDLVVVQAPGVTLVCPKSRAQDVKAMLRRVASRPDGAKYV
ncbi:MAG: sugar phosphate nucleotidyltransferase, partial [Kiritimatiellaeota bacterium]|nr:sugar phosphate nucleotidyltransferase [Kiritimatiellota bacterium]